MSSAPERGDRRRSRRLECRDGLQGDVDCPGHVVLGPFGQLLVEGTQKGETDDEELPEQAKDNVARAIDIALEAVTAL